MVASLEPPLHLQELGVAMRHLQVRALHLHPYDGEIGILLPNNQRQQRTLHIQKDMLPYAVR
jgi:hypothetical protein